MARKKHRHDRGRHPQRRTTSRPTRDPHGSDPEDQELFRSLRQALRADGPIELLETVSGLLEVTDPRGRDPFAGEQTAPSLDELVDSFIGTPYAETTGALTVMRALATDPDVVARIDRELSTRRHPMPDWLAVLDRVRLEPEVWSMTHVLGDGDDYLLGVAFPSGQSLSALVYVDHNLGTVVKDAFVVPEPLEDLAIKLGTLMDDPDQSLTRTDAATARAVVEEAIAHGALLYPPLTTDTWPMCRPLVEWMVRMLPEGGSAPPRKEWSEQETAAIAEEFFASSHGAPYDREDERGLLESVLWFGTGYANGNPFLWSPVTVELLLADWFPRKVLADPSFLAKLPDLLRAFIRWCHDREGIRVDLTDETLAAVDHYEPNYQRVIRSARPQGPAALVAGLLDVDSRVADEATVEEILLERLDRQVGGRYALSNLDDQPLPDEPFEWAAIDEGIEPVVREVLALCDRCADELLDVEHRTAMRRFLGRAAVSDPAIFRRKASPARAAAAVAWVVCRANGSAGANVGAGLTVQELLGWFGVKGSVSQRAEPLLRANGVDPYELYGEMELGTPDLLTARRRRATIDLRDHLLAGE